jgi:cobalt-zinc-cadmium efflux system membrane fusion protein
VTKKAIILIVFVATAVLTGCHAQASRQEKAAESAQRDPLGIAVTPELDAQIRVGEPQWQAVSSTLNVAGRVEADETRMARVSAPVTGRIVELTVIEGEIVKRGQTLATIHSTDLSAAQSAFLKAYTQQQLAQRAVGRARQLLDAGVIGEAEVQRREAELQQASAELSSSRDQLTVLGMSSEALQKLESTRIVNSVAYIVSSIDGRVLERKATIGQVVEAAETVFVIADLSNVWLVADVPEQSARALGVGKRVQAEIPALPGETIAGIVSFVSAVVNPETRTVRARMDLPNPNRRYKPAMLANITMLDGAERKRVIPENAVVREGNEDNVFLQLAPGKFVLHHVTLGGEVRAGRVLEDGLREGDKIVLDGAYHLNNERKRLALQAGDGE